MGIGTESAMLTQLKKAQGETNDRLDALLRETVRTNDLLSQVVSGLSGVFTPGPQGL
jgi:hypothetical protein